MASIEEASCLHASHGYYRFLVLFFNCLLTFGSYFCFDMPSVLQENFVGELGLNCTTNNITNVTTCVEHLGLTQTEYNLLYTVYAWMNALVVIGSGILIDKVGQGPGAVLFSGLCVVGSAIFAAGYFLRGKSSMLVLFLLGRLLFGAGNGSLTIAQNRVSAFWFDGKELAFAFGATLAFSRLGSILNFLLTENFVKDYGIKWTLWGGSMLCALGFIASIILLILDKRGITQLKEIEDRKTQSRKMRLGDICYLKAQFWLLSLTTMLFYNTVFPFVADASSFIEQTYGYKPRVAAIYAGSVYDISLLLTPLLGISVDFVGYRGILASSCAVFTIPVFAILAFASSLHPLVGTLLLGATYSAAASSLWPSVPLVVNPGVLGTAMGLMTSMQMVGIGTCNIIVGTLLDTYKTSSHKWKFVMLFLLGNAIACVISSLFLNLVDYRRGGILNKTRKRRRKNVEINSSEYENEEGRLINADAESRSSLNA